MNIPLHKNLHHSSITGGRYWNKLGYKLYTVSFRNIQTSDRIVGGIIEFKGKKFHYSTKTMRRESIHHYKHEKANTLRVGKCSEEHQVTDMHILGSNNSRKTTA